MSDKNERIVIRIESGGFIMEEKIFKVIDVIHGKHLRWMNEQLSNDREHIAHVSFGIGKEAFITPDILDICRVDNE